MRFDAVRATQVHPVDGRAAGYRPLAAPVIHGFLDLGGGTGPAADRGPGHRHDCREAWVIDDTGFAKEGTDSPGLARQYSGTLGKIGNFQIAVSLHAATDDASCPPNLRLYLPEALDDTCAGNNEDAAETTARRARAEIPETVRHRAKWSQALVMIDELAAGRHTPPAAVADAGYGEVTARRQGLTDRGINYVLA